MTRTLFNTTITGHGDRDPDTAVKLAAESQLHLSMLVLGISTPPPVDIALAVTDPWVDIYREERARVAERRDALSSRLASELFSSDVDGDYVDIAYVTNTVGERARYADLTVVGPELLADPGCKWQVVNGALFGSGRPVLLVPDEAAPTLKPARVLVAWNNSVEAARAVRESLDMLAGAEDVQIVMVDPSASNRAPEAEAGVALAAYLARQGVKANVRRVQSGDRQADDVLEDEARDWCSDLIVMGAYGHSRLREWAFGGVTRAMIEAPPVPVLMAR